MDNYKQVKTFRIFFHNNVENIEKRANVQPHKFFIRYSWNSFPCLR